LNFSKASCLTTLSICSSVSCRPSYVYCCCCCKCCSKCYKCRGLEMAFVQSSYTFASKHKCFHPLETLCHVPSSLFSSDPLTISPMKMPSMVPQAFIPLAVFLVELASMVSLQSI
jgi:hypothetical protein